MTDGGAPLGPSGLPRRVHCIGVAGAGMSALARLLVEHGHEVTGSDREENTRLEPLRALGVRIAIGHAAGLVTGAGLVVASPAIPRRNVELEAARAQGLPVWSRARAVAALLGQREVVCVAGSHGKTTTTAMLSVILDRAGRAPGFMIGGITKALGDRNASRGQSPLFVSEACEAFRALDHWRPRHCIVTNLDDEHSEHYGGPAPLVAAFQAFLGRVPAGGVIALCGDDPGLAPLIADRAGRCVTYGLSAGVSVRAENVNAGPDGTECDVTVSGRGVGRLVLRVPGLHNLQNALAAVALALGLAVPFAVAAAALRDFAGVARRLTQVGEACGVRVVDDFAHHPAEIAAGLAVARGMAAALHPMAPGRVIVVLQPQLHSRVRRLAGEYAAALSGADRIVVLPIDAAGEQVPPVPADGALAAALAAAGLNTVACPLPAEAASLVEPWLRHGDVVVTMGPGAVACVGPALLDRLRTMAAAPEVSSAPERRLHSGFERQAARQPEAPCIRDGGSVWSYAKVDAAANRLARRLITLGIAPDRLVALHLDRSPQLVALVLGVLKAGGAYLPLDPQMDRTDLAARLRAAGVALVVTESLGSVAAEAFAVETPGRVIAIDDLCASAEADAAPPSCPAQPQHLAYAIFTSGSTGRPHLVGVEHRNVVGLIDYACSTLFEPADLRLVPFIDSIGFDACVHQIFTTLEHGGTLLLERDLASLMRSPWVAEITALGGTPSVLRGLLERAALPPGVRVVSLGGEVVPEDLIARLRAAPALRRAFNFYGPTETTIYSTVACLLAPARASGRVVGHPVAGTRIHIVGPDLRPVRDGAEGELLIAGNGVTRGYLGEAALTAERFITEPVAMAGPARCYRTGDLGRRRADGAIEFLGRLDDQFKLNGVRLEPVEIEAQIEALPGIARAAVAVVPGAGGSRLIGFVVAADGVDVPGLRRRLQQRLPAAMIPAVFRRADGLPLTASGKLDRRALAGIAAVEVQEREREHLPGAAKMPPVAPRDAVEARLLAIWRQVLGRPALGAEDQFFDLGGDSLASVQLVLAVEQELGLRLDAAAMEALGSVAEMAVHVRAARARPAAAGAGGGGPPHATWEETLHRQQAHLAAWVGHRHAPDSLIVTLNRAGTRPGLFWCFQGFQELKQLAAVLGPDQPVHGMRSGHLVMRYTVETVAALAASYVQEMLAVQPQGAFRLGGNCQGGVIARAAAIALRGMGRAVSLLILMEQGAFWSYDEPVVLIHGRDSPFNPYRRFPDPDEVLRRAYPAGFSLVMIDGSHGRFFDPPNLAGLAAAVAARLSGEPLSLPTHQHA